MRRVVEGALRLVAEFLDELLNVVPREVGEEWVLGVAMGEAGGGHSLTSSKVVPKLRGPYLGFQDARARASRTDTRSLVRFGGFVQTRGKQCSEPEQKAERGS
jgi:hypothetical protein